ncbi:MAG: winged helix-turn-helix transcriptional regulator [Bauldia sp.]|nr:winged helix-turn-helix transcriptional regulator [Bauldia sp.]
METHPCLCSTVRRAARAVTSLYDEALEAAGIKATQFALLRHARRLGAPSITALAEAAALDRSTLGRNLRVLAREGLVRLGPGSDERTRTVKVTAKGARHIEAATPLWEEAQARLAASLGAEKRKALLRIAADLTTLTA